MSTWLQSKWQNPGTVVGVNCVKDASGKVLAENDQVKKEWRKYMEKLLNEEKTQCHNL